MTGLNEYQKSIEVYRQVLLLNNLYNAAFGALELPILKLGIVYIILVSVYCIVRLSDSLMLETYVALLVYFCSCILVILLGAVLLSQVYNISSNMNFGRNMKEKEAGVDKTIKALPLLKCNIDDLYHMEAKAKLTLVDRIAHGICFCPVSF